MIEIEAAITSAGASIRILDITVDSSTPNGTPDVQPVRQHRAV
jgi:hypothetical protein